MFLVELVMQGVRGIRELARLRFQSGFNFVAAGNESGKTTAVDAMQRLLFPKNDPAAMDALVSRHTPDASRGALVVCSDDGAYFRVIQDFSKRAVNLSKYNGTSKEFTLLHKDWESTTQFMAGLAAGISEEDYERIFILRREVAIAPAVTALPAAPPRSQPVTTPQPSGGKNAAALAKLAELRETLRKAELAADADYHHQSAALALEEIDKKIKSVHEVEQKYTGIEESLAQLTGCEKLPDNIAELADAYDQRFRQKTADTEDMSQDLENLTRQYQSIQTIDVFTDKWFIVGAATFVLSFLVGVFVLTAEYAFIFPVGVLVSLIVMAAAWYNGYRKNVQRKMLKKEIEALQKDLAEIENKFSKENIEMPGYMKTANAQTPGELMDKAQNYRYFISLKNDVEEEIQRALGGTTVEELREQREKQQQEVQKLEQAALELKNDNIDTYSIRQDIERLEAEASSPAEATWDFGGGEQDMTTDFGTPPVAQGGFLAELTAAGRVGGIEMETLIPAVEAAAQRNLSAITGGKYVRIEVGQEGEPVVLTKEESRMHSRELSHGTRALVTFCVRTGLVEALAGKRRLPFILDDPLAEFDPARQKAACQVLRALGAKTQVVLFGSNPALKAAGDAFAELK